MQSQNNLEHKECKIKANTHVEGVKSKQIQIYKVSLGCPFGISWKAGHSESIPNNT